MAVWDWFLGLFNKDDSTLPLDAWVGELPVGVFYKKLAIESCVSLIGGTLTRGEFQTFEKGEPVRRDNYYLFNVSPNPNKSAAAFWRSVVRRLVYDSECLVVQQDGHFYVADSFTVKRFAFRDYLYSNIVIDDYELTGSYISPNVFHFELQNESIRKLIDGLYQDYGKLIAASQDHYKRNQARRGTLDVPTNYPQTEKAQAELDDLLNRKFKRFFEAEGGAVLPLTNGMIYTELSNLAGTTKGSIEGRDIRAFIDDVFDFVATAFNVPPQLLRGHVADTEKAVDNYLTFCIGPWAELVTDEINRKLYGKERYLERTYMKLDTSHIRASDITAIANALDVLTRIGAYSVDESLKALGMEPLDTEWSRARWMTKNYERIERRYDGGD